jgi:4-amino-4-deoxy-L-arabinose transferase-like glycosyltransferase
MFLKKIIGKIIKFPLNLFTLDLLFIIISAAFIVRVYRINDLLGFYYDQGRDALVIWKLLHEGKLFLIGPITGLSGIFLGPLYYYLITPFYLIGGGNPVYPAVFLAFLSTLAILVIYLLGKDMHSRTAGIIAATVASFSYHIVTASRWFANPTPILLTSMLIIYSMWKIIFSNAKNRNNLYWMALLLLVGISLQFESASAVFYIPIVLIFVFWQRSNFPKIRYIFISLGLFLLTFIPQIIFNFRHDNILLNNLIKLFISEKAFRGISAAILVEKIKFFWGVFSDKLYAGRERSALIFMALSFAGIFVKGNNFKKGLLGLFALFFTVPIIGFTFFQGNYGNIYDYYMTGYYLPFILLFSIGLAEVWKTKFLKIAVLIFFISFFQFNGMLLKNIISNPMDGPTDIKFGSQLRAVNWIFENVAGKGNFNVDVYVPPVIPYSYDYLFLWQGTKICGNNICGKVNYETPILYLLYEQDPPNPERLQAWLSARKDVGVIQEEVKFGGITIERRMR